MNNVFPNETTDIGTDPTTLQVIDSLDIAPTEEVKEKIMNQSLENETVSVQNSESLEQVDMLEPVSDDKKGKKKKKEKKKKSQTPNPDQKPHAALKKIVFVVIVLLLMAGVAFGLYFYLTIANKNKKSFTLKDVKIYSGGVLSNNISDYGTFSKIDIATCLITGLDSIDVNVVGTYDYIVTCGKIKHKAKIEILPIEEIKFSTNILYKAVNEIPSASEFVSTSGQYEYLTEDIKLKEYAKTTGGPYGVKVSISHESGSERIGYGVLYVVDKVPSINLNCANKSVEKTKYSYYISDYFIFDDNRKDLGSSLRLYNYKYNTEEEFENALLNVNNNRITIDNREGYFIMDNKELKISIVTKLDKETLKKEYDSAFPTTYTAINSYYTNTKNYTCSN